MKIAFTTILTFMMSASAFAQSFKSDQLKFERVKTAYDEKWAALQQEIGRHQPGGVFSMFIAAYKSEGKLELWLKTNKQSHYSLFKTYNFSAHSGTLGPKVKEGDLQTPEGFYHINVFNPQSTYYLSLGLDYPNAADLSRSGSNKPGGDIYIHGKEVTIGCIPLTDDKIKEVYVLATEARNNGQQQIPVYIFPFKMTVENRKAKQATFPQYTAFWTSLQPGYDYLQKYKNPPPIKIIDGGYHLSK